MEEQNRKVHASSLPTRGRPTSGQIVVSCDDELKVTGFPPNPSHLLSLRSFVAAPIPKIILSAAQNAIADEK